MSFIHPCSRDREPMALQPLCRLVRVDEVVLAAEQHMDLGPMGAQAFRKARLDGAADDGRVDQPSGGAGVAGEEGGHPPAHAGPDKRISRCGERLRPCGADTRRIAVDDGRGVEVPTEAGEVAALAAGPIAFESMEKADVPGAKLTRTMGILSWESCHVPRLSQPRLCGPPGRRPVS